MQFHNSCQLRLRDTRTHAMRNVLEVHAEFLYPKIKIFSTKSVSNFILVVEVHCHNLQGMMEAFTGTLSGFHLEKKCLGGK